MAASARLRRRPRSGPLLFFDWTRHEGYAKLHARCDELVLFEYGSAPAEVAAAFAARGLGGATVGLERYGLNPVSPILDGVEAELKAGGATVAPAERLDRRRRPPLQVPGRAGADPCRGRDRRHRDGGAPAAPSSRDDRALQAAALLTTLLADGGSEVPATPPLVVSSPTAWVDTHSFPSRRVLEEGTRSRSTAAR